MIPDLGDSGEGEGPDEYDAAIIAEMARDMKAGYVTLAFESAWRHSQPHPATGRWLTFVWENPAAWQILGGDVDRAWFMRALETADFGDGGPGVSA